MKVWRRVTFLQRWIAATFTAAVVGYVVEIARSETALYRRQVEILLNEIVHAESRCHDVVSVIDCKRIFWPAAGDQSNGGQP